MITEMEDSQAGQLVRAEMEDYERNYATRGDRPAGWPRAVSSLSQPIYVSSPCCNIGPIITVTLFCCAKVTKNKQDCSHKILPLSRQTVFMSPPFPSSSTLVMNKLAEIFLIVDGFIFAKRPPFPPVRILSVASTVPDSESTIRK